MSSFSVCSEDPAGHRAVLSMIYLTDLHLCSGIRNRNATATPRTRHAQLLLPLSRRSGTDHAAAWMVSSKEAKEVDSHERGAGAIWCPWRRRQRERVLWTERCPPMKGGLRGACCRLLQRRGVRRTATLCAQHMSNTLQQTCPCISIWMLKTPIKVLWARCAN